MSFSKYKLSITLNGDHNQGFTSSMGHLRSDSVELLVYDGMRTYPGYQCCITGHTRQRQPCRERVNI
jgi:ribosomal protein S6E (S10)